MATIVERKTAELRAPDGKLIKKAKSRYTVMIRLKGRPPQTKTFARKTDAKKWAVDTEKEIRDGLYFRTVEAKKYTLNDLIDRYLKGGFHGKPASKDKYKTHLDWWRSHLGHYFLIDVTPSRIAECRDKLLEGTTYRGTKRSPATVNRYLATLSDCLTFGVKECQWLDANPISAIRKCQEPPGRVRYLSDDERVALVAACRESSSPILLPVVMIALTTGARHGEIMGLTWGDVDLQRGLVIYRDTKNGTTRSAPLVGETKELIAKLAPESRDGGALVFGAHGKPASIREPFETALERAGIEDFRFHDLRHTAASYLAMSGATLAEIASVLGHKTLAMVKRYAHIGEQHTAGVVTRMTEKYFNASALAEKGERDGE